MAVGFTDARQAVAARILANMPGWSQSDLTLDEFGRDPSTVAHKRFVCWLPGGEDTNFMRGSVADGAKVNNSLVVRFSWKLPPKDKLLAYDDALEELRKLYALLTVYRDSWPGQLQIIGNNWENETLEGGEYLVYTVNFIIQFQLDLTF